MSLKSMSLKCRYRGHKRKSFSLSISKRISITHRNVHCCAIAKLWKLVGPWRKMMGSSNISQDVDGVAHCVWSKTWSLSPGLNGMNLDEFGIQRDGATCYIMHDTIHFLRETFEERMISRILHVETGSHVQAISWPYVKSPDFGRFGSQNSALLLVMDQWGWKLDFQTSLPSSRAAHECPKLLNNNTITKFYCSNK